MVHRLHQHGGLSLSYFLRHVALISIALIDVILISVALISVALLSVALLSVVLLTVALLMYGSRLRILVSVFWNPCVCVVGCVPPWTSEVRVVCSACVLWVVCLPGRRKCA